MTVAKSNGTTTMEATNILIEDEKKHQHNALLPCKEGLDEDDDDEITLEDLAPDGGWGWMVAIAMTVVFVSIYFRTTSYILSSLFLYSFFFLPFSYFVEFRLFIQINICFVQNYK